MNNFVLSNFLMLQKPIGNGKANIFHLFSISINSLLPYYAGNCGSVKPLQAEIWWEAGYTMDTLPVNYRADMQYSDKLPITLTVTRKFKSLINLMSMSSNAWKRPENPERTYACNSTERALSNRGQKLARFLL